MTGSTQHFRILSLVVAALLLNACQTTSSKEAYTAAFMRGANPGQDHAAQKPDDKVSNYNLVDLKPGERPDISSDEAGLWMMMDKAEKDISTSGKRVTDPELNAYVKNIVCRVAGEYCEDFRVYIVQAPSFNASMAPNGTMLIHTGFLLRARNEAQLAAVVGHEISHYLRRHSAQRVKDTVDKTNALIFVRLATAIAGVAPAGDIAMLATVGSVQAFSRDHEREADGYGLALMVRAGYDPSEASSIWKRVMRERDANPDKQAYDGFFATHPPSEERNAALNELAGTVENAHELRTGEAAYQDAIRGLRADFLREELAKRQYSTSLALFDMLLEDGYTPSEVHYFRGELFRLRGEDGDSENALSAYREAMSEEGAPAELYRSYGLSMKRAGNIDEAHNAFRTYLDKAPDAPDREMIRSMIEGNI